jgi:hypothetical protein
MLEHDHAVRGTPKPSQDWAWHPRDAGREQVAQAFSVQGRYAALAHAAAFQAVLDRPRSLHLIAWAREPDAIRLTVAPARSPGCARAEPLPPT